jgi:hypothetical protein
MNIVNNKYTEENYKRVMKLQNTFFDIFEFEKDYLTKSEQEQFKKMINDLLQESKQIEKELDNRYFSLQEMYNENNCGSHGDL